MEASFQRHGNCCCKALADLAVIPMGGNGLDALVLASFQETAKHGGDQWWLHVSSCLVCRQDWMVAQDERISDTYYLRKVAPSVVQEIIDFDWWPEEFLTYERVLRLGKAADAFWRFVEDSSPALVTTAKDLRRERPDILVEEIADLLAIPVDQAASLMA